MSARSRFAWLAGPLHSRLTYRRWSGLIVGGGLLMPYMMAGAVAAIGWGRQEGIGLLSVIDPVVFLAVLPVVAVTGLVLPVRAVAISVARALFGVRLDASETDAWTWPQRWRTAAWFTALLGVGGVVSGVTLGTLPFVAWLCTYPVTGNWLEATAGEQDPAGGWATVWTLPAGLLVLAALAYFAAGAGAILARLAFGLLGPTPEDRLAVAERRSERLAERNRLARELHDSVGHALSVVTVQAAAAGRVLDADPRFARRALGAIEDSARGALEDLDYVLGLLREEEPAQTPEQTLEDLAELVDSSALDVDLEVIGRISQVPRTVSREAYRIVQEGLTNVLRHAGYRGPVKVDLRIAVADDRLEVVMTNPVTSHEPAPAQPDVTGPAYGGGRGLAGMRERVGLLRGELSAGPFEGRWRLVVRLPLRASAVRS